MSPYDASKGGLPDLMKAPKSPVIQDLQSIVRLSQELSAERARADSITAKLAKWNILVASGCTPGGSEFHDDPERTAAFIKQCRADLEERWRKYKRESNSLTASITAACAGTGCLNAHELAEALREERAKLAVTEADVTHYQEMLRVSEEALKQARADRDVLVDAATHAKDLLDAITPYRNCSCHLAAPCSDCVDNSENREIIEELKNALTRAGGGE